MIRLILTAILLGLLTACGSVGTPSRQIVNRALELQISQTQQQLNHQLKPSTPLSFDIARIKISEKQPLVIADIPTYRVRGNYEITIKQKSRITQQKNPFEVYLQRQQEGKTWRLLLPQAGSKNNTSTWRSYLIQ